MSTHGLRDGERYELLGELASGGMATVYLARMRRPMGFSRLVAIKCMHPQFAKDPSFVSMFMDEARLTAHLRHPNIVPTLDIVAEDGHLLLVMEYVDGISLASLLRFANNAGMRVPLPIACAIVHDLLLGLHEAHQAKDDNGAPLAIIHRDVSPQNVIVGIDGLSRVLDFGVAKARQNTHQSNDNEIKGKIPYMPPEQLFGEQLDHKVDVYAAGVTLWETLVCERLFDGPSETALVKKISEEPIAKPSTRLPGLPPEIDEIVMRALSRNASDRYESALAMAEAIASVVSLPTRTDVSTWVRQFVSPREVHSSNRLAAIETPTTRRTTILALLEKASMLGPSAKRPSPPARARTKRIAIAIGIGAVAFAIAGVGVARVAKRDVSPARLPAAMATSPAAPKLDGPAMPLVGPASMPPVANDTPSQAPPRSVAHVTRPFARAVAPASTGGGSRSVATHPVVTPGLESGKKDCKIPFTIDVDGHKHFKAECL